MDAKKIIQKMVKDMGKSETERRLIMEGVSSSTAQKLVSGRYVSEVGQLITQAIMRAKAS